MKKCNPNDKKCQVRKIVLSSFFLIFGLGIVAFSAFRVGQTDVQAQDRVEEQEVIDVINNKDKEEPSFAKTSEDGEVDYYLPYPGILPDHPLYWVKMIRDKVLLAFTKKPVDRFERLLLYADKRVGAAEALIKGGKVELGVTTADKGEKYLDQVVSQFKVLAKEGKAAPETYSKLTKAILKHEEILTELKDRVSDQSNVTLDQLIEKTQRNYQEVKNQFN